MTNPRSKSQERRLAVQPVPLTGPALAAEVERIVFGDDLGCFAADGTERRERIKDAVIEWYTKRRFSREDLLRMIAESPSADIGTSLRMWDNRHGKPWHTDIALAVTCYRAAPRPFDRDPALALGLLPFNVSITGGEDRYTVYLMDGFFGESQFSEFPDAPPEQQRVLAFCAAVCRSVLASKEQADGCY